MNRRASVQGEVILAIIDDRARWIVRTRKALEADPTNADLIVEARLALARFETLRAELTKGSALMAGAA